MYIEIYREQNEYEKMAKKFIICFMIVFVFLSGIFYINRKSIGYVLDYLYFIRVVETNSFRLNSIPTLDTKKYI